MFPGKNECSILRGGIRQGQHIVLSANQTYQIRVTLLDGGYLWHCPSTPLLEDGPRPVHVGDAACCLCINTGSMAQIGFW